MKKKKTDGENPRVLEAQCQEAETRQNIFLLIPQEGSDHVDRCAPLPARCQAHSEHAVSICSANTELTVSAFFPLTGVRGPPKRRGGRRGRAEPCPGALGLSERLMPTVQERPAWTWKECLPTRREAGFWLAPRIAVLMAAQGKKLSVGQRGQRPPCFQFSVQSGSPSPILGTAASDGASSNLQETAS